MNAGRYEGEEIAGALAVVRPGDRVLELGAGLGVVGAVIARNAQPDAVLSFEANPNLIPHIEALHRLNGLEEVMEVRHQVVTAGPNQPQHMTFHLRNSFLGSSLIDTPRRQTTAVDVPTVPYGRVINTFRPDVLIMDIEGGELDLLRHANLRGIRAIVIEFHPDAYGKEGVRECKDILKLAHFERNDAVSTRFVWTCTRDDVWTHPDASWPDPSGGWSERIQTCENAIIKPSETSGFISHSGVQTAQGRDVPIAAHWRNKRRSTLPFKRLKTQANPLDGRWVWGGVLYSNFAHFIAESLGRLWALDVVQGEIDGIVFVPRRPGGATECKSFQTEMFKALGVDVPIKVVDQPHQVGELIVPGQGFGLGAIIAGTPSYRRFRDARFARDIAPEGGDKLYISRSQLPFDRGVLLGEQEIEAHLQADGYEIFHPQKHTIPEQIARYKAARHVVSCDGSALHLLAFCGMRDQHVAMIMRRQSTASTMIERHLTSFTGRAPLAIKALKTTWENPISHRARMALGEPDMAQVQTALAEGGFIAPGGAPWEDLDPDMVQATLAERFETAR
ncbi:FkbM family methyltransferase [uncultured Tateyamaria sp.]|uniref:FkbM family methyltransferase n=1 Tax=uncultured Tateyamaria sp. TaxID=455651 RepID=UPI002619A289|nr:FkbM family methyltransferase [uncultured Tateyamaria sp.]